MAGISARRRRGVGRSSAVVAVLLSALLATVLAAGRDRVQVSDSGRAATILAVGHQVDLAVAPRHERAVASQPWAPRAAVPADAGMGTPPGYCSSAPVSACALYTGGGANARHERAPPFRETI